MTIVETGAGAAAKRATIKSVSSAFRVSVEEAELMIDILEDCTSQFFSAAEAGHRLRSVISGFSLDDKPEPPKKPVFFKRDIVPNKKRRFGNR